MTSKSDSSVINVLQKLEFYCSYQERCHFEVSNKLNEFTISNNEKDKIIVSLIDGNYLNEERFASVFTVSKFHQKKWGKIRIFNELKARKISNYLIEKSLNEIDETEYFKTFDELAVKHWQTVIEKNNLKKRKKFCDFLLRKGWESNLVYEKVKELEK